MRLAIISGGSKGLGAELCAQFSQQGFRVVEFSRSGTSTDSLTSVNVDLSSPEASRAVIRRTLATLAGEPWQEIVAINNAGTLEPIGPAARKAPAEVLANININFTAPIVFVSELIAAFQTHPCRKLVANISSGAARHAYSGWSLYCAGKAGIESFMRAVALEQSSEAFPLLAININPGVMDTGMQASIRRASQADFPDVERFIKHQENGALRAPADVAAAVLRIVGSAAITAGELYSVSDYGC